jgi:hypothetical protein
LGGALAAKDLNLLGLDRSKLPSLVPPAEAAEKAKEIAIWVDDDQLPMAHFFVTLSVPTLLKRHVDGRTRPRHLRVKMVDVANFDLKVHPSPERIFQGRRTKAASRAICLFEHQMDGSAGQISEALLGTLEADTESKSIYVEAQGLSEIGDVKFRNDGRCAERHAGVYQIPVAFTRRLAHRRALGLANRK